MKRSIFSKIVEQYEKKPIAKALLQYIPGVNVVEAGVLTYYQMTQEKHRFDPKLCPNMRCRSPLVEGEEQCSKCSTSWLLVCPCERKESTAYEKDICQKCRKRCPLPTEYKRHHSLTTTIDFCAELGQYEEALQYFEHFADLQDSQLTVRKQEIAKLRCQQLQERQRQKLASKDPTTKQLLQQRQRQQHIEILDKMIARGNFNEAFDYYQQEFPDGFKDETTAKILEEICTHLVAVDLQNCERFVQGKKYAKAIACLENITGEFRIPLVEEKLVWLKQQHRTKMAQIGKFVAIVLLMATVALAFGLVESEDDRATQSIAQNTPGQMELAKSEIAMDNRLVEETIVDVDEMEAPPVEGVIVDVGEEIDPGVIFYEEYVQQGIEYIELELYDKAIEQLLMAIELDPQPYDPYYQLARVYSLQKNRKKSLQYLRLALEHQLQDFAKIRREKDLHFIQNTYDFQILLLEFQQ